MVQSINDPNIGNKTFSLDTNAIDTNFTLSSTNMLFYYFLILFFLFSFFRSIKVQHYMGTNFHDYKIENVLRDLTHPLFDKFSLFSLFTYRSKTHIGLSPSSYLLYITLLLISFLLLLKALVQTQTFQLIISTLQTNSNVNPYNNPLTVTKIPDSPTLESNKKYSFIAMLSLLFLLPYVIHPFIKKFDFTQRDIDKNLWIRLIIYFCLLFPILYVMYLTIVQPEKLNPLLKAEKYFEEKDKNYILQVNKNIQNIFLLFSPILFLFLLYSLYIYALEPVYDYPNTFKIIVFIFVFFLPFILITFTYHNVFEDTKEPNTCGINGYSSNIENAVKNGINNFYQSTVKYNYPCFFK